MALKIRLSRVGTKNEPHYRVVVAEERSRRDGDAVEQIGAYNPRAKGNVLTIKLDRVDYWVSKGAKPTATMHSMIKRAKRAAAATAQVASKIDLGQLSGVLEKLPAEQAAGFVDDITKAITKLI